MNTLDHHSVISRGATLDRNTEPTSTAATPATVPNKGAYYFNSGQSCSSTLAPDDDKARLKTQDISGANTPPAKTKENSSEHNSAYVSLTIFLRLFT